MHNDVPPVLGRRCATCGSSVPGRSCGECGRPVAHRSEIGLLAGVNNNFGTVNNVYNIGAPPQETEIVDLRDVQDGLNQRFPERIQAPAVPKALPPGPGTIRTLNKMAKAIAAILAVGAILIFIAFLWL